MLAPNPDAQPMVQEPAPEAGFSLPEMMPEPGPEKRYDVKIKRCVNPSGKLKVEVLAPEDFGIESNATVLDEDKIRFCFHKYRATRSDLKQKYPSKKAVIDDLPAYSRGSDVGQEKSSRESRFTSREGQSIGDKSTELIEVFECYVKVDRNGDGIAEWLQVVTVRGADKMHALSIEEWGGDLPFTDIVPDPMPHRWAGRSVFDETYDIQRIKTVLMRQTLDNLYQVNNPMLEANRSMVENPDALITRELGGVIWKKSDAPAVIPSVVPFVAKDTFPVLDYYDGVAEKRTGIGRASMALDPDALQNQTATAVQATQDIKFTKVEVYARNIAESGGLKRLFKCMLRLFCENQNEPMSIRLRGEFVDMDPRGWNADMDCTVNVGLGAGSRDRDLAMLQGVAMKQELAIQGLMDPFNPILNVGHLFDTYRRMAEAAGLKSPEVYFPEISQEQVQQIAQQKAQNPPPNPEAQKAQAQMQIEQMKLQSTMQLKQAEMQAKAQQDQMKAQLDQQALVQKAEIEKIQAQADIATNDRKVEADIMLAREKFALEAELKRAEHAMKMQEMQVTQQQKQAEFQMKAQETGAQFEMQRESHEQKLKESQTKAQAGERDAKSAKMLEELHAASKKPRRKKVIRDGEGRISHVEEE